MIAPRPRRNRSLRFVPLLLLAFAVVAPRTVVAQGGSPLRLNEILAAPARDWDGSGTFSSRDDEWIELVNTGSVPLDLAPWFVTDGDSVPRMGFSGTLAPGAVLLVTGGASVAWERANGHPVFGLSLGNTGDRVLLWRVTGPDTVLVDEYAYRTHECAADRAVGRGPDGVWRLEDALNPYTGTASPGPTGCAPTPGTPNSCGTVEAVRTTWTRLKRRWR